MRLEPPAQKGLENKQARSPREDAVGAALPGPGRQPSGDRSVPRPQTPASGTETEVSSMPPGLATCRDRDRTQVPPLGSPSPCCPLPPACQSASCRPGLPADGRILWTGCTSAGSSGVGDCVLPSSHEDGSRLVVLSDCRFSLGVTLMGRPACCFPSLGLSTSGVMNSPLSCLVLLAYQSFPVL